jgi:hypothetical protein
VKIIRTPKRESFTILSNHVLRQGLSLKARGLYWTIVQLPDDWDFNLKGLETLLEGEGRYAVRSAMKELEEKGFAKMERIQNEQGKFEGVEWHFFEMGIEESIQEPYAENLHMDEPYAEKPKSGFPKSVFPKSENLHQYNTNNNQELNNQELTHTEGEKIEKANEVCVMNDLDFEVFEKNERETESTETSQGDLQKCSSENLENFQDLEMGIPITVEADVGIPITKKTAMPPPFVVKDFAVQAQSYAEAQAKQAESETAVLYRFSWVLNWLSTYQPPKETVERGLTNADLLECFQQAVDVSIEKQKAQNPRFVQAVFKNAVEAWIPRSKITHKPSSDLSLRNVDKAWEHEPQGVSYGF